MNRKPIANSSNLVSAGYDPDTQTLEVEFAGGNVGTYSEVTPDEWNDLDRVIDDPEQSTGSYFAKNIRNAKPYAKAA